MAKIERTKGQIINFLTVHYTENRKIEQHQYHLKRG